jgi:hypothetical protein
MEEIRGFWMMVEMGRATQTQEEERRGKIHAAPNGVHREGRWRMTDAVDEMETNQAGETFAKAIIGNMTMKLSYGFAGGGRQAKEEEHGEELDTTREGASEGEFRISLDDDH